MSLLAMLACIIVASILSTAVVSTKDFGRGVRLLTRSGALEYVIEPEWKMNQNGQGYSIDSQTPGLRTLILEVKDRLADDPDCHIRILEVGVGNSHVLARAFQYYDSVSITFVDPGSDFSVFPRNSNYVFISGTFPAALECDISGGFDFIFSARALHCNTPTNMIRAMADIRKYLKKNEGKFFLETTCIKSAFYQDQPGLVDFFARRRFTKYPGYIPKNEFRKYWPTWTVGDVTLIDCEQRLRNMLLDEGAGFAVIERLESYEMRSCEKRRDRFYFVICR